MAHDSHPLAGRAVRGVHVLAAAAALSLAACGDTDDDPTADTLGPEDVPIATDPSLEAGDPGVRPPGESPAGAASEGQDGLEPQGGLPEDDGVIERGETDDEGNRLP